MEVIKRRGELIRLKTAIKNKKVTLGFIGGSITDADCGKRWPEYVIGWFSNKFPGVKVYVENAAIGATGSDAAVFRAERDIINRNCDIVFVEYAVNDNDENTEKRMKTREGLIRKLLKYEMDVALTYTYCQDMYSYMVGELEPPSIAEFELLAEHYNISSIWMGLHAMNEVKNGLMRWEEWLPDGLHPEERGSYCYAQSVIEFLNEELAFNHSKLNILRGNNMPNAIEADNWEKTHFVPFEEVSLTGPWAIRRGRNHNMMEQILTTDAIGSRLSFDFIGRGLSLAFDFGRVSAEFKYRLDQGEWSQTNRERPWWVNDRGWFKLENLYNELSVGEHSFELEVVHGNREECKGTSIRLIFIGVIE